MVIYILDANALIDMKGIATAQQWEFFLGLGAHVEAGRVVIPAHVIEEVGGPRVQHPDMPGAWAKGMESKSPHPLLAQPSHVELVMAETPTLLDPDADSEQADPYVLALALELRDAGHAPIVVTKDKKDRPGRISLRTACAHYGIDCEFLDDFLAWVEIEYNA